MSHTRHEPAAPRLQRSELAVPGSQPAFFAKALESEADYVFLDLEDAVAPGDKEQARLWYDRAVQWMEKNQPQDKELPRFRAEAAALLGIEPPELLRMPKPSDE